MKFNLLFFIFLFLSFKSFAQDSNIKIYGEYVNKKIYFNLMSEPSVKWLNQNTPQLESMKLKAQVKILKKYAEASPNLHKATKYKNGFVKSNGKMIQTDIVFKFNKKGYFIERSSVNTSGKGSYRNLYEYDTAGNKIKTTVYRPYNALKSEKFMKYNVHNQKIEEKNYKNDTLVSIYRIEYDQENRIATSYFTQVGLDITRKSVYYYNKDNQEILLVFYDFEDNINRTLEYTYNKKGLLIERYFNNVAKNQSFRTILKYNKSGKLISEIKYDKNKKIINRSYIDYDKKGNLIKNASTKHDHEVEEITKIDEKGNWIEKTISTLGFIEYVMHRKIEYY